jgi:hypothetical protein
MSPEFNWYFSQKPSDLEKLLRIPQMKQKLSLIYIIITCHCTIIIKYDGLFISPPNIIIPGIPPQLIFFSLRYAINLSPSCTNVSQQSCIHCKNEFLKTANIFSLTIYSQKLACLINP